MNAVINSSTQREQPTKRAAFLGSRRAWPQRRMSLTIIVPALLYYLLFRYYPVVRTFFLSTTD
jgi:hypothetical protein